MKDGGNYSFFLLLCSFVVQPFQPSLSLQPRPPIITVPTPCSRPWIKLIGGVLRNPEGNTFPFLAPLFFFESPPLPRMHHAEDAISYEENSNHRFGYTS